LRPTQHPASTPRALQKSSPRPTIRAHPNRQPTTTPRPGQHNRRTTRTHTHPTTAQNLTTKPCPKIQNPKSKIQNWHSFTRPYSTCKPACACKKPSRCCQWHSL